MNIAKDIKWYQKKDFEIFNYFNSSARGLTSKRAEKNKQQFGINALETNKKRNLFQIVLSQMNSPLVYILIFASGLVFLLKDYVDAIIIIFILVLNTIIGAIQEGKAEDTLAALKKVIKSYAKVTRDGHDITIEDSELVAGDVIHLKDGSIIPADARLIETNNLKVNQSSLTGESEPILKIPGAINDFNVDFNEQNNMVFRGTYVISGLAKAIVVRTGNDTLIGQISYKLGHIESEIPLKQKIAKLSNVILVIVAIISLAVLILGLYNGASFLDMVLTVVAISVSAIPESLPVIVTLVLASGVWRMSQKKVLVKKLQAAEALGQAQIIAVDKTGTITKNQMTVGKIYVNDRFIDVTGSGYSSEGGFLENNLKINLEFLEDGELAINDTDLDLVGKISTFTAIADFNKREQNNWKLESGDPTEAALTILGLKFGMNKIAMENRFHKTLEIPFNLNNKYHATINQIGKQRLLSVAGSPEVILNLSNTIYSNGKRKKLQESEIRKLHEVIKTFSGEGCRILALAAGFNTHADFNEEEVSDLTFVGFVAISDAIRPEVFESVKKAQDANIKLVMITGDHAETAKSIAQKVGIYRKGDIIITGLEINQLDEIALSRIISKATVFARVSPEDKLKIIKAFQINGDIVAMTGDGINDALSLAAADLGVAMGQNGTEVAQSAADIILTDDNFGNIIHAAEEGRHIYWTIRKAISHLLATNLGELLVVTIAVFANLPLPLVATQILWLNLVTDTFLVASLSVDPKEPNLMTEIYRRKGSSLLDKMMITRIILVSSVMTFFTFILFLSFLDQEPAKYQTVALTMLTVFQVFNIFSIKSHYMSIFAKRTFNNIYMVGGVALAMALHIFAIYNPFMQGVLNTTGLNILEWIVIILMGLIIVFVEEIRKFIYRLLFIKMNNTTIISN